MRFLLPEKHLDVLETVRRLAKNRELYVVGGAVRDLILGRRILDYDFAVEGSGTEFAGKVAKKVGGAFVSLSRDDDEARIVVGKELILDFKGFSRSIHKDLADRDFTINAIAVEVNAILDKSKDVTLIDPFCGEKDIKQGFIRKVGPDSISSDPLRMLRAYRFAAQLGFRIDPWLIREGEKTSVENVAMERISYELMQILSQPDVYPLVSCMIITGLAGQMFPFPGFWTDYAVRSHSLLVFSRLEHILYRESSQYAPLIREKISEIVSDPHRTALLKLGALFHDVCKPETRMRGEDGTMHFYGHDTRGAKKMRWVLSRHLRFSNLDAERVELIVARHMHLHLVATAPELTERAMRRFMRSCGECAVDVMILDLADGFATAGRTRHLERTIVKTLELAREDAKRAAFVPLVNGNDLIAMGLEPGPLFKVILSELEELQWERKISTKQEGLDIVREKLREDAYRLPDQYS